MPKKQESSDSLLDSSRHFNSKDSQTFIFKQSKFLEFLNLRILDSSFTRFANKVGLSVNSELLKADSRVVLNFPYKDCVLKGGQSKDEDRGKEIFFNEIIARDEIDVLFAPKVLCNFKYISNSSFTQNTQIAPLQISSTNNGESSSVGATSLSPASLGKENLKDSNLLIKGNNLIALHSLKANPAIYGKVKLIYIDPPYNTGNDSFNYNDRFSHSTWLTFIKNRLEIAKEFLREDGVIFVQCDDNEQAYLKVLMDEIFGRENFVSTICWRKKTGGGQDSIYFAREHEYILCYQKKNWHIIDSTQEQDEKDFTKIINGKKAKILKLEKWGVGSLRTDAPSLYYPIKDPNGEDFYPIAPNGQDGRWRKKPENLDKEHIFWQEDSKGRLTPYEVIYFDEVRDKDKILKTRTIWLENGNTTQATNEIKALFSESSSEVYPHSDKIKSHEVPTLQPKLFATPKPEALLKRIIEISTKEGDLVMDFFAGSGTTLAVAHKMGRKWVGIEQMDYIESITKERLKKVVAGEQGGISKAVGYNGGGGFIYAELMSLNAVYKDRIAKSENEAEITSLYNDLASKAFIDYRVDIKEMLKDRDFNDLSLAEKKAVLRLVLDSNMDYVPYADIKDSTYGISSEIIELNRAFYGEKNE